MADHPETTATEQPARRWRRRGLWAFGILAVLVAALAAVAVNRAPLAERLARDRLAGLGLAGSGLTVTRLTPWRVEVADVATGPARTARIRRLVLDLSWSGLTVPQVSAVTIDGMQLDLAVRGSAVDWGDLAPLLKGGGQGGGSLPPIAVSDSLVVVAHDGGPTVVSVEDAAVAPAAGGGLVLKPSAFDLVHPLGQAAGRLAGTLSAAGVVAFDLTLEDAQGTAGPVALAGATGRLRLTGDPARPADLAAEGTFDLSGLALPGGLLAGGRVGLRLEDGRATATADLTDAALGLSLTSTAEGAPFDVGGAVALHLRAAAADLARLRPNGGVTGAGSLEASARGVLADLLSGDPGRLPPADMTLDLNGLSAPGLPGPWAVRARAAVALANGAAILSFDAPATASGPMLGGDLGLEVPGRVRLHLDPFAVTGIELQPLRVVLSGAEVGGAVVSGPLVLVLTPRNGGLTLAADGGAVALRKADFAFAAESPVLTLRTGGQTAVLRTAGVRGGVTVGLAGDGPPGVALALSGLAVHAPDLDVEAEGLSLKAATRGGPDDSWNLQVAAETLRHVAAAPFAVAAKGHWNRRKWDVEGTLRQHGTGLIASFAAGQDARTGAGRARLDTVPLNLAGVPGGVHSLTPLLAPFVKGVTGTVQVSAVTAWDKGGVQPVEVSASLRGAGITPSPTLLPAGLKGAVAGVGTLAVEATVPPDDPAAGRAAVALTGGNLRLGSTQATGISGRVDLDRLWPPRTPPGQELAVERVLAALPAADGRLRFQITGPASVKVERAELTGIGGRVWAENVAVADGVLPDRVVLNVDNLGLADLARQVNILGLEAEGRLSGRVPVELGPDGRVAVRDGLLEAQGKGVLAFRPPNRATAGSQGEAGRMDLVLDILENLRFDGLSLSLDGDARKDLQLRLRVHGRNPGIQQGRPVDLTVNLTGNLGEAIRAELQNFDIKGLTGAGMPGK